MASGSEGTKTQYIRTVQIHNLNPSPVDFDNVKFDVCVVELIPPKHRLNTL